MSYLFPLLCLLVVAFFTFMYHYERNGNPLAIGDTFERIGWALSFSLGYGILFQHAMNIWVAVSYFVGSLLAIYVPHGFAQNAGHRAQTWKEMPDIVVIGSITAPKWWPGFLFLWVKNFAVQDFLGMASVGLIRGALVFLPPIAIGASVWGAVIATIITMLWQPISYWAGYKVPFTVWTNTAYSSTWGEFFVPIGWAIALATSRLV